MAKKDYRFDFIYTDTGKKDYKMVTAETEEAALLAFAEFAFRLLSLGIIIKRI